MYISRTSSLAIACVVACVRVRQRVQGVRLVGLLHCGEGGEVFGGCMCVLEKPWAMLLSGGL